MSCTTNEQIELRVTSKELLTQMRYYGVGLRSNGEVHYAAFVKAFLTGNFIYHEGKIQNENIITLTMNEWENFKEEAESKLFQKM